MKKIFISGLLFAFTFLTFHSLQARPIEDFTIQVQQQKRIFRENLTFRFVSVLEDSRCPQDTNCVWAGNAKARIQLRKANGAWKTFDINLDGKNSKVIFRNYRIDLTALNPAPRSNIRINRLKYRANFEISKIG